MKKNKLILIVGGVSAVMLSVSLGVGLALGLKPSSDRSDEFKTLQTELEVSNSSRNKMVEQMNTLQEQLKELKNTDSTETKTDGNNDKDVNPFLTSLKSTTFKKYSDYKIEGQDLESKFATFKTWFDQNKKEFTVTSVSDGDTVGGYWVSEADNVKYGKKNGENKKYSIRMVGLDTPEKPHAFRKQVGPYPNMWQTNWAGKATALAEYLLFNKDREVKVYILPTGAKSFSRVVGSVWYELNGELYSYAHNVVEHGLAIASRPWEDGKKQTHYPLNEGVEADAEDITKRDDNELLFENTINSAFKYASKNDKGFWNSKGSKVNENDADLDFYQDSSKSTSWYDIFNNKANIFDLVLPYYDDAFASFIEQHVYTLVDWWKADKSKIKDGEPGRYCTLDTIYNRDFKTNATTGVVNPCDYITG